MRSFFAVTVAVTMIATSALAATGVGAPLASGKPAGIKAAQGMDNTVWYLVAGGIVIAGIALVASGDSNGSLVAGTTGTATTTGTQ